MQMIIGRILVVRIAKRRTDDKSTDRKIDMYNFRKKIGCKNSEEYCRGIDVVNEMYLL